MRLEDMSFTDYLTAEYYLRERQRKERMKQAEFEKYAKEHNLFICTTNIIEQIREEIEQEADHYDAYVDQDIAKGLYYAGEIIDKYLNGGMSPEVKEHYERLAEYYSKKGNE